jgi:hypothetical protein
MSALTHPPKSGDPLHCAVDGKLWPIDCDQAKAELAREYRFDPMAMIVYLATWIAQVAKTFPWLSPHEVVRQYVGWLPGHALVWAWPLNSPLPAAQPQAPRVENDLRFGANAGRWSR